MLFQLDGWEFFALLGLKTVHSGIYEYMELKMWPCGGLECYLKSAFPEGTNNAKNVQDMI
jgi:hypothetical protein